MRPTTLCPAGARPRSRVILVLAPLSSTNTSPVTGSSDSCSCQRALCSATSGRFCSAANRVFFIRPAKLPEPQIDGGRSKRPVQARAQFRQGGIRLLGKQLLQAVLPLGSQQRAASAQVRLWLERAAFLVSLPHPPDGSEAEAQKLGNLPGALAPLIKLKNTLTNRRRDGSHMPTPCQIIAQW